MGNVGAKTNRFHCDFIDGGFDSDLEDIWRSGTEAFMEVLELL